MDSPEIGRMMREMGNGSTETASRPLTPRQDRLESSIVAVLSTHGTRSELRELVHELADFLRMQGATLERAVYVVRALGARATPAMSSFAERVVGDSADDRMTMMIRWCTARFNRDD
jgi:hypothetical protein